MTLPTTLQNDRERMVAETLAFVRHLADVRTGSFTAAPLAEEPRRAGPVRYADERDLRKEMQARLEAFRNRQRFLEIEREAYYQQAMQRIRAATEQRTAHDLTTERRQLRA